MTWARSCERNERLYSFVNADRIWDFLISIGMRPFVELSFMPTTLASGNATVFHYRGNVTPPRDFTEWAIDSHCAYDRSVVLFATMAKGNVTKSRILETALRSASVGGLEGITLGKVAADVGMSKSGLFAHFDSKETLQVDVLNAAAEKFTEVVIAPALAAPRGEPRLRALFDRWIVWEQHESLPGGCVFMHASAELDDKPGPARDALVDHQRRWMEMLAKAVRLTIEAGHFRADVDPGLFAFQLYGIVLSYYHSARLFRDPDARSRAVAAFESVVAAARRTGP